MRVLLVLIVFAACRPATPAAPFTLRVAVSGPLGPVTAAESGNWSSIASQIVFEPLVRLGEQGDVLPALASRAELVGSHALRVWLRSDARFNDGSPVTVDDVAQSVSGRGLRATDEGQSILISSEDAAGPPELLASRSYIYRRGNGGMRGSGLFRVDEQNSTHILLTRVTPAPGLIARVRIDSYPTPQDAFSRTLKGDADMLPEVQPRWVEFFEGVPRLRVLRAPGPSANMVAFNLARLSRDERIALARQLAGPEVGWLAFGPDCVPPMRGPESKPLAAGRPLDVMAVPFLDRFAFAVRRALNGRAGEVQTVELQKFVSMVKSGDFDLATIRPRVSPPITAALNWRTGAAANWLGYSNPAVDAALDARDWTGAQRALSANPPGAVVCTPPAIVVLDARIRNATFGYAFWESLPQWEVAQ